jgi:hypothetical protein
MIMECPWQAFLGRRSVSGFAAKQDMLLMQCEALRRALAA